MPVAKRTVEIENVNTPGRTAKVDADKFEAMKTAMLAVLPAAAPGLNAVQMKQGLLPLLPDDQFPGGATAGWWMKAVQLDLEAKGLIARELSKPLRWHRR